MEALRHSLAISSNALAFQFLAFGLFVVPIVMIRYYDLSCGLIIASLGILGIVNGVHELTLQGAGFLALGILLVVIPLWIDSKFFRNKKLPTPIELLGVVAVLIGLGFIELSPSWMVVGGGGLLALGVAVLISFWKNRRARLSPVVADGGPEPKVPESETRLPSERSP